jgi:hypothetical protein
VRLEPSSSPPSSAASLSSACGSSADEGGAGAGAAAAAPFVSIRAITAPTATLAPSATNCSPITPADGAFTSTATLSVSRLASGSSAATASPGCFSHWPSVAWVMDSPSVGTVTSVDMLSP